ncbi:hypothetical protein HPB50_011575 [Hyalomma asiaticum]|uniref:Uncharacterized protein n=1 Tax=Hyalomma asiaticum TaxID=266040 RepID=A0ACB7SCY8_HYAAI|nr:hypothetical protein HPB50_011575 [Hyalomma asiaticum]
MSVCAQFVVAALLLLTLVFSSAGAQLQPQASAGSGDGASQGQEAPLRVQQSEAPGQSGNQQSQNAAQEYQLAQQPEVAVDQGSGAANPGVQIPEGVNGREEYTGQSPPAETPEEWVPPAGYVPYPVPLPAEQPQENPQYDESPPLALPEGTRRQVPAGPYWDERANEAFQAWSAAQRQKPQRMPLPYMVNYYPNSLSNVAESYAPYRPVAARHSTKLAQKYVAPAKVPYSNGRAEAAVGWPRDVLVPFPSQLIHSEPGHLAPGISASEDHTSLETSGSAANASVVSRLAREDRTKYHHNDTSLVHYRRHSSKPPGLSALGDVAPSGFVGGNVRPGNIVLGSFLPDSVIRTLGNISSKGIPANFAAGASGDLGTLPAFLLPPKQVIHTGNNLTFFYFQLDNATSKSNPGFRVLRNEANARESSVYKAAEEHKEEHHEEDHGQDHHAGDEHPEDRHAAESDHVADSGDQHDAHPAPADHGSASSLSRSQRSADDGTFLGKLSEWACLGRTVDGETVYCDSVLDYARLLSVLGAAALVVTVAFVFAIRSSVKKRDDDASEKKAPADAAADEEERVPLTADNEDCDHIECDFRDDGPRRLFVQILKRDMLKQQK